MKRWISCILLTVLLLSVAAMSVFAHAVPDINYTNCSFEAVLRYDGEPVTGGALAAVRVGFIYEENGDYSWHRFVDDAPVTDLQSETAAAEMEQFYRAHKDSDQFLVSVSKVGDDGKARFENLKTGVYLVLQETPAPGYSKIKPFLVVLPYLQEGAYQYSVSSTVKTELEREPVPTEPEPTKPSGDKLPQTGQLNWPIPVLTVLGVGLVMLGVVVRADRRKEKYEKK